MEFRDLISFWVSNKLVRCDGKILWDLALTLHGINTLAWHFATELCTSFDCRFSSTRLLHGYRDFVYYWEVYSYIWVWKLSSTSWFQLERELKGVITREYLSRARYLVSFAHKHNTLGRVKRWTSQFASNDWHCIHESLSKKSYFGVVNTCWLVVDFDFACHVFSREVKLACSIVLNVESWCTHFTIN